MDKKLARKLGKKLTIKKVTVKKLNTRTGVKALYDCKNGTNNSCCGHACHTL